MDHDYINLLPGSIGYSPGSGSETPMMSPYPHTSPPRYAYPHAPVPVSHENAAITHQPTQGGYGVPSQIVPLNVPPGLEYLAQLDRLLVKQKVELLEALLECETNNKYEVKDSQGRDLYTAKEETDCCARNFLGAIRPFNIKIKDMSDHEVIHLSRPLVCCLQRLEVFAPPGQLVGTVEQEWSCVPQFSVKNAQGTVVLKIEGPCCPVSVCGSSVEFQVMSEDGVTQVGKISKQWSGLLREAFTDADNFGISFPIDLDTKMKAVMLGACFLIDFMFFENAQSPALDLIGGLV